MEDKNYSMEIERSVSGLVRIVDGRPLPNAKVVLYAVVIESSTVIEKPISAPEQTDDEGKFIFQYRFSDIGINVERANLQVRVIDENDKQLAGLPEIIYNAPDHLEGLELIIPAQPKPFISTFQELVESIKSETGVTSLDELNLDNQEIITYLSKTLQKDTQIIQQVIQAHQSQTSGLDAAIAFSLLKETGSVDLKVSLDMDRRELDAKIKNAVNQGAIASIESSELKKNIDLIITQKAKRIIELPNDRKSMTSGDAILLGIQDKNKREEIANIFAEVGENSPERWEKLKQSGVSRADIDSIRLIEDIRSPLQNYLPLVKHVLDTKKIKKAKDLVKFEKNDWSKIFLKDAVLLSDFISGENLDKDQKAEILAEMISQSVENSFPAAAMHYKIISDRPSALQSVHISNINLVKSFLRSDPAFEFGFQQPPYETLKNYKDKKQLNEAQFTSLFSSLRTINRLYQLSPNYEHVKNLLNEGISGSVDIARMEEAKFVHKFSPLLNGRERVIYQLAKDRYIKSLEFLIAYGMPQAELLVLQNRIGTTSYDEDPAQVADWRRLFGTLDMCTCEHCQSALSPAAYFVDILEFLEKQTIPDGTALELLLSRRPDLEHIELTCQNTNTQLPIIDLVNEILENAIAGNTTFSRTIIDLNKPYDLSSKTETQNGDRTNSTFTLRGPVKLETSRHWWQTTLKYEELKALPQHVNHEAYKILQSASYPWILPFNLSHEAVSNYLNRLNINRTDLVKYFQPPSREKALHGALAYLGLTIQEWDLIKADAQEPPAYKLWGFNEIDLNADDNFVPDPSDSGLIISRGKWYDVLRRVDVFLQQSGISYVEALNLIQTLYINPNGGLNGLRFEPPTECDLAKKYLTQGTALIFRKIYQFVKLSKNLKIDFFELDKAIQVLSKGKLISQDFIIILHQALYLKETLNVDLPEVLIWFGGIDKVSYDNFTHEPALIVPSEYARIFRDRTLFSLKEVDALFPENPDDLNTILLDKQKNHLQSILFINENDLDSLIKKFQYSGTNSSLTKLSKLYRYVSFSRSLDLGIEELLVVIKLLGNPFLTPEASVKFVEQVKRIQGAGLNFYELDYILTGIKNRQLDENIIKKQEVQQALTEIRLELQRIADETSPAESSLEQIQLFLARLDWSDASVNDVILTIRDEKEWSAALPAPENVDLDLLLPKLKSQIKLKTEGDGIVQMLTLKGLIAKEDIDSLSNLFANANNKQVIHKLYDDLYKRSDSLFKTIHPAKVNAPRLIENIDELIPKNEQQRIAYLLGKLQSYLKRLLSGIYLKQHLSQLLGITVDEIALLPLKLDFIEDKEGSVGVALFANEAFVSSTQEITANNFPNAVAYYEQWLKIVWLKNKLNLPTVLLPWQFGKKEVDRQQGQSVFQFFDWNELAPANPPRQPKSAFAEFDQLLLLLSLKKQLQLDDHEVAALLSTLENKNEQSEFTTLLLELTGWKKANWEELTAGEGYPGSFRNMINLKRWIDTFEILRKTGLSLADCTQLSAEDLGEDAVALAQSALKQRYQSKQWLAVAQEIHNPLRSKKRDALAAYLLGHPEKTGNRLLKDKMSLSEYFLIDVEMEPKMLTSRIKQGISSVQMFIQRCLLNLEYFRPAYLLPGQRIIKGEIVNEQKNGVSGITVMVKGKPVAVLSDENGKFEITVNQGDTSLVFSSVHISGVREYILDASNEIKGTIKNRILRFTKGSPVVITSEYASQWNRWRKYYRVWEANRKIFLYPENWIEPELRDDKSPFFKELEGELLQNDLNTENGWESFMNYLDKYRSISPIEILAELEHQGFIFDQSGAAQKVNLKYVFCRTIHEPHLYYFRKDVEGHISPWQLIDLQIQDKYLIPLVWNHELYLFWPLFSRKTGREKSDINKKNYVEIKLDFSVYKNNKWSQKKNSNQFITFNEKIVGEDFDGFVFDSSKTNDEQLVIICGVDNIVIKKPIEISIIGVIFFLVESLIQNVFTSIGLENSITKRSLYSLVTSSKEGDLSELQDISIITAPSNWDAKTNPQIHSEAKACNKDGSPSKLTIDSTDIAGTKIFLKDKEKDWKINEFQYVLLIRVPNTMHYDIYHEKNPVAIAPEKKVGTIKPYVDVAEGSPSWYLEFSFIKGTGPEENKYDKILTHIFQSVEFKKTEMFILDSHNYDLGYFKPGFNNDQLIELLIFDVESIVKSEDRYVNTTDSKMIDAFFMVPSYRKLQIVSEKWASTKPFPENYTPIADGSPPYKEIGTYDINPLISHASRKPYTPLPVTFVKDSFQDQSQKNVYIQKRNSFKFNEEYALYNWETLFHIPFQIAVQMTRNQRFEEAQKWFHFIFDPTSSGEGDTERFWKFYPFYEANIGGSISTLEELIKALSNDSSAQEITNWADDPFKPHAIARRRIPAYMKAVVMKYLDNLIEWGDNLFRRDTLESINEAIQLYILAYHVLGRKPKRIPPMATASSKVYQEIKEGIDLDNFKFSTTVEDVILPYLRHASFERDNALGSIPLFCLPINEKLLEYWSKIEDRLFKIHHSLNIEGIERQLPLFEQPIDPALLVRAAASGLDISTILDDLSAPTPIYRFMTLLQKAKELANEVKSLGSSLISVLEKKDAEALTVLRAGHEHDLLKMSRRIKEDQIKEVDKTLEQLDKNIETIQFRIDFFGIKANVSRLNSENPLAMNEQEKLSLQKSKEAFFNQYEAGEIEYHATKLHLIPTLGIGFLPFTISSSIGGVNFAPARQAEARKKNNESSALTHESVNASTLGGHQRRMDDWNHQYGLAIRELEQIKKQRLGTEIRKDIAEKELENHEQQIENARTVLEAMRDKYTNVQLYQWMKGQISAIYFQTYRMAFDMAKRAEKAMKRELGIEATFVNYGYWDNLHQGLLSGEKLTTDIHRLEIAYLDRNKREFEITKHISLVQLNPAALLLLKMEGYCEVDIPELIFDMDFPGHYFRRIKSVSLSIPCIAGPYAGVNCTLRLLHNRLRLNPELLEGKYSRKKEDEDDKRFRDDYSIQSIAASSAQNDSGMFEVNFRDERYLPFEGCGVIGKWRLELSRFEQFNYNTISDVILHLKYTAREDDGPFKTAAETNAEEILKNISDGNLVRLFSLRHDFPQEFNQLKQGPDPVKVELRKEMFPFFTQSMILTTQGSGFEYKNQGGKLIKVEKEDEKKVPVLEGAEINADEGIKVTINKYASMDDINDIIWGVKYSLGTLGK